MGTTFSVPLGSHFGWHRLNGLVSGLMIMVFIGLGRDVGGDRTVSKGRERAEQPG